MKRVRLIGFLAVMAGVVGWQGKEIAVRAASGSSQAAETQKATSASTADDAAGAKVYAMNCAACHGQNREGNPPAFPSLVGVGAKLTEAEIVTRIHQGKGSMPAFPDLQGAELTALVHFLISPTEKTSTAPISQEAPSSSTVHASPLTTAGNGIFQQNCSFCHGQDAMGGESGPDLTSSRLVRTDIGGDKIGEVVRNGVAGTKMPAFALSSHDMAAVVAFIHAQASKAASAPGQRRGVDVADLQTGNADAGKRYFDGPGGCVKCHSATGDLAGIASRLEGLQLEEQMLFPRNAKSRVTVTEPEGGKASGVLEYQDEFTIGLRDASGTYHSWPAGEVKYVVDSPADAHIEQFSKYTDDDIHNLMAYMQTLR